MTLQPDIAVCPIESLSVCLRVARGSSEVLLERNAARVSVHTTQNKEGQVFTPSVTALKSQYLKLVNG